jgi:hypothetical protein
LSELFGISRRSLLNVSIMQYSLLCFDNVVVQALIQILETLLTDRPPTIDINEVDPNGQAGVKRRLPQEVKQKLAKVARLSVCCIRHFYFRIQCILISLSLSLSLYIYIYIATCYISPRVMDLLVHHLNPQFQPTNYRVNPRARASPTCPAPRTRFLCGRTHPAHAHPSTAPHIKPSLPFLLFFSLGNTVDGCQ